MFSLIRFLIIIILFICPVIFKAQETEDWHIIFNGKEFDKNKSIEIIDLRNYNSSSFVAKGFYNTQSQIVLRSQDGGNSWSECLSFAFNFDTTIYIKSIEYPDSTTIYVHIDSMFFRGRDGLNSIYDYMPTIYKSTDLGSSWTIIPISERMRSTPSVELSMYDVNNGILVQYPSKDESVQKDIIWITNDGWKTWKKINLPDDEDFLGSLRVKLYNNNILIWINIKPGFIYKSSNIDESWKKIQIPTNPYDYTKDIRDVDLSFINDSTYYLFGSNYKYLGDSNRISIIIKTTNSGLTWEKIFEKKSFNSHIDQLTILDKNKIIASGDSVYRTNNEFTDWTSFVVYTDGLSLPIRNFVHINDNLEYGTCYGRYIMKYTGSKALLPPEFISPINYWDNPLDFSIEWIPIIGANNYHLQVVEREQNFNKEYFDSTFFINDSLINGTSFKLTNTKYNKEYACRIRAMNSTQKSGWIEGYWVTVQDTTSVFDINSIEKNTIIPNPVSDYIELKNEFSNDNSIIKIYNLYGTKLFELPYSNKIDIRSMPCGVYFLEINKSFLKFIKF